MKIISDNYLVDNGGDNYLRCEYIAREGLQSYENLGWTNGHKIYYVLPKGAEAVELKFRETGYDTEFTGEFECSDPLYNKFWKKALRTLYLTMRDTYMVLPRPRTLAMDGRRRQRIGRSVLRAVRVGRAADAQMAARPGRMAEDRRRDLRPRSLVELGQGVARTGHGLARILRTVELLLVHRTTGRRSPTSIRPCNAT